MNKHDHPVDVDASSEQLSFLHDPPAWSLDPAATKPIAVLICHGMGQQVPFETLSSLAERLHDPQAPAPLVRHVRFTDPADPKQEEWLPRAEIQVATARNGTRQVHVYEVYWAPLTESRISLTEVVNFLGAAGTRGLWQCRHRFQRWVFGQEQVYDRPLRTPLSLLVALGVVASLVVINTVLMLVAGAHAVGLIGQAFVSSQLVDQLTVDLIRILAVVAGVGGTLALSWESRRLPRLNRVLTAVAWVGLVVLLVAVGYTAWAMGRHYLLLHEASPSGKTPFISGPLHRFTWRWDWARAYLAPTPRPVLIGLIWATALGVSLWVRSFFIQYLGDTAIYLDSYKVDKFHKVREQIKQTGARTARLLYGARQTTGAGAQPAAPAFLYDRLVLAGHSLGSVITYDTLNAMLRLDETTHGGLHVAARTPTLLTFGSPLDKTAFLFDSQHPEAPIRDGLAASVQPMIRDRKARALISWVNLYANADVVSGKLEFYELPLHLPSPVSLRVRNVVDPAASTPIAAHLQYWDGALLKQELLHALA
ncbi:hypothetical protein GCM10028822_32780 [Hymenobacter terrigena]